MTPTVRMRPPVEGGSSAEERRIWQRVPERPSFSLKRVREVGFRELAIRFVVGALTSVAAGALTLGLGTRVGGIMLAFPAILAASLTLIEHEEDSAESREDARGAAMGGSPSRCSPRSPP